MAAPDPMIDDLRREIDAIDDAMHDLLMRRAETYCAIDGRLGQAGDAEIQRALDATTVRRLVRRHAGAFPRYTMVRMWRELIVATLHMQGALAVAVHAPEKSVGYWDLARDHFGSGTPMTLHRSARRVLREVADRRSAVGLVALPVDGEAEPWWPLLMGEAGVPRVVARLPFVDNDAGRLENLGALAIARVAPVPSGEDVSLFALETEAELSRARLRDVLAKASFAAKDVAAWADPAADETRVHLIEIDGFLAVDDARFAELESATGKAIRRVVGLGGYARPLGLLGPNGN
ncbi:MAG: chorismate mutase [Alphaproteobacteria bacterium]